MTILAQALPTSAERAVAPSRNPSTGTAPRPRAGRPHAGRWCVVASVLLHAVLIAVLWRFVVPPPARPDLEFCVEVAGAAAEVVPPEADPVEQPDLEVPLEDLLVESERPTDEPVTAELPELEAQTEARPPEWTASIPSVTARLRPPAPPAPEPAPAVPPIAAALPPAARPAPPAAAAGASRVERASPLATNRRPVYPTESRRRGEEGTVVLLLTLGPDGSVTNVALQASSGFPRLDEAAVAAAWGWRFRPAVENGVAVASVARQRVAFHLDAP